MIDDDDPDDGPWREFDVFDAVSVAWYESQAMAMALVYREQAEDACARAGVDADEIARIGDEVEQTFLAHHRATVTARQRRAMH